MVVLMMVCVPKKALSPATSTLAPCFNDPLVVVEHDADANRLVTADCVCDHQMPLPPVILPSILKIQRDQKH